MKNWNWFEEGDETMRRDGRLELIISFLRISESVDAVSIIVLCASALLLFVPIAAYEEAIYFDEDPASYNLTDCSSIIWYINTSEWHTSPPSLRSGPIRNVGTSCVEKWIEGPASINFWWKVDTPRVGMLTFTVDNEVILQSTSSDWSYADYAVTSGRHRLSWVYRKLSSYPEYAGAGWIDDLRIVYPERLQENVTCCDQIKKDIERIDEELPELVTKINLIEGDVRNLSTNQIMLDNRTKIVHEEFIKINESINTNIYPNIINLRNNDTRLEGLVMEFNDTIDGRIARQIANLSINQTTICNQSCIGEIERIDRSLSGVDARVDRIDDKLVRINESISDNIYPQIINLSTNYTRLEGLVRESDVALNDRLRQLDTRINETNGMIANLPINQTDLGNLSWISENVVYVSDQNANLTDVINKSKNKIILLADGVYHTGGLKITTNDTYIRSFRKWGAVLDADGADNGITIDTGQNVTLEYLIVTDCVDGIHIQNSTRCNVVNNFITDFGMIGINLPNSDQCTFMLNVLYATRSSTAKNGLRLEDSNNNHILFNDINISSNDDSSSLYNISSSKGNKILVSNRGYIWEDNINCICRDNNSSSIYCERNNMPASLPLQNNTWEFC